MNNSQNTRKNLESPNYQISGIQPNYNYNSVQNLNFDNSSIPQSGYADNKLLKNAINDQQQFVNNYNKYSPHTTFNQSFSHNANSSNLENLKDFSQYNIEKTFEANKPISRMLDTKNKDNTIYANLNENLMKESIMEVRLNIDSMDRNIQQYPDPFNYVVTFGPIVNSGINNSALGKNNIKTELKNSIKNNKNINKNNYNEINTNLENSLLHQNPNFIVNYTDRLKRSFNPYITRDFDNIKFIRLDNVVLPRFDCLKLNEDWDYCRDINFNDTKQYIKDDYERIKKKIILNNRYIPDDNLTCSLFTDRFIQIYIKEIENNYNLGTNAILTKAFTVFPDKQVGILYWRGNPYYAVKTYKDSLLGVINRLSIQFYNSWGLPITLNTSKIDPEKNIILNLELINPELINFDDISSDDSKMNLIIKKFNEIIKCIIFINSYINKKIPFYNTDNYKINDLLQNDNSCNFNFSKLVINQLDYDITDIYKELNDFVTTNDFITCAKIKKNNNKKEYISIDNFINNIFWFNKNLEFKENILFNLQSIINNYKSFVFTALDRLKVELLELPINPYFQNHLTFVMGMYTNELNTKIDFYQ